MASKAPSAVQLSQESRLEALKGKHSLLSSRIEDAQKSPSTTDYYLRHLKKQKLKVKEEIESIGVVS